MWLKRFLTAERVQQFLGEKVKGSVIRYELPQLHALHFVLEGALGGGVTRSLAVDAHGKSYIRFPVHGASGNDMLLFS